MKIRLHPLTIPEELLAALQRLRLEYTFPHFLYYCVLLGIEGGANSYCGVFGDGDNASYEWFIWRRGKLQTSDKGYGDTTVALRDVLNKANP